jgi:hypothetical protein
MTVMTDAQVASGLFDELQRVRAENARFRDVLEPFAALGHVKGGTLECDRLKALLTYMLEINKPGDGVDVIYQFTTACLNARKALEDYP